MFQRLKRGGWPYSQPPNVPFDPNWESEQSEGLKLWMPWGGGTPGAHRHVDRVGGLEFVEGGTPVWTSDGRRGWSLLFDNVANEYLLASGVPLDTYPITMMAWALTDDLTTNQYIMSLRLGVANFDFIGLQMNGGIAGDPLNFQVRDPPATIHCRTTTGFSANVWHHCCGVAKAANDRAAYIDGGSKATSAVATTITWSTTEIGRAGGSYMSGRVMDVRIYDVDKTDAQVSRTVANPWELWRPRIRRLWAMAPVAPPAGAMPMAMDHYRRRRV